MINRLDKNNISKTTKGLILLSALSVFFVLVRIIIKDESRFSFLIWNLFLAWIPFILVTIAKAVNNKLTKYAIMTIWILFYPNSPYIITDLLHLKNYSQNILWYDSLTIFLTALTGLLIGLNSIYKAKKMCEHYLNKLMIWILLISCNILTGFGIYLGRYCRLNSWDMFNRPIWFVGRVLHQFENPLAFKLTITFATALTGVYYIFENFFLHEDENISRK